MTTSRRPRARDLGIRIGTMTPAAVLAARARQPVMIVISLLVAAFVVFVLVASAGELPRH